MPPYKLKFEQIERKNSKNIDKKEINISCNHSIKVFNSQPLSKKATPLKIKIQMKDKINE